MLCLLHLQYDVFITPLVIGLYHTAHPWFYLEPHSTDQSAFVFLILSDKICTKKKAFEGVPIVHSAVTIPVEYEPTKSSTGAAEPHRSVLLAIAPFAPHRRTAANVVNARRPSQLQCHSAAEGMQKPSGSCGRERGPGTRWMENAGLQQRTPKGGLGKLFFPTWHV